MKINYFSPLLPTQSGISEVTELLVPALSQYAEVIVWTERNQWSPEIEQFAQIRLFDADKIDWIDLNQADLNIYHIGNNVKYHYDILSISQRSPGLVVLHDLGLHHLFYEVCCNRQGDWQGYINLVTKYYGSAAGERAQQFLAGAITIADVEDLTMTEWAIENAAGVFVHHRLAFQQLAQSQRWPVCYQPLAYHAPPLITKNQVRSTPPYRLVIFGYLGHNRRVEIVLKAISEMPNKNQFRLDIYGSMDDEPTICQKIDRYDLKSQVTVHGFVVDELLDRALANAHLAINLRYPTMGEASLSQLRIWRHALPSLVTQIGWYADQPNDTVLFVRPEHEVADIQQHLQRLIDDPTSLVEIGMQGRKLLEQQHSPDAYAKALIEFAKEISIGYQQPNTLHWIDRVSQEVAAWQVAELGEMELSRVAAAMHFLSQ